MIWSVFDIEVQCTGGRGVCPIPAGDPVCVIHEKTALKRFRCVSHAFDEYGLPDDAQLDAARLELERRAIQHSGAAEQHLPFESLTDQLKRR